VPIEEKEEEERRRLSAENLSQQRTKLLGLPNMETA
jgi:hypothetical protein